MTQFMAFSNSCHGIHCSIQLLQLGHPQTNGVPLQERARPYKVTILSKTETYERWTWVDRCFKRYKLAHAHSHKSLYFATTTTTTTTLMAATPFQPVVM